MSFIQLLGLVVLVLGLFIYYGIVQYPCLKYDDENEIKRNSSSEVIVVREN